jgi:hypothetical protein
MKCFALSRRLMRIIVNSQPIICKLQADLVVSKLHKPEMC